MKKLSLFDYFVKCYKEYANFEGRARRREFWGFMLFWYIIYLAVYGFFMLAFKDDAFMMIVGMVICFLLAIASIVPQLAVSVRRLHDIGKSGWYYFVNFIPLIGSIWLLVMFCTDSEPSENKYGKNPKEPMFA